MHNPPAAKEDRKNEIKHDYTDGICLITAQTWSMCDLCRQAEQTSSIKAFPCSSAAASLRPLYMQSGTTTR